MRCRAVPRRAVHAERRGVVPPTLRRVPRAIRRSSRSAAAGWRRATRSRAGDFDGIRDRAAPAGDGPACDEPASSPSARRWRCFAPRRVGSLAHVVRVSRIGIGGAESNVAIGVARLGHAARLARPRRRRRPRATRDLRELRAEGVERDRRRRCRGPHRADDQGDAATDAHAPASSTTAPAAPAAASQPDDLDAVGIADAGAAARHGHHPRALDDRARRRATPRSTSRRRRRSGLVRRQPPPALWGDRDPVADLPARSPPAATIVFAGRRRGAAARRRRADAACGRRGDRRPRADPGDHQARRRRMRRAHRRRAATRSRPSPSTPSTRSARVTRSSPDTSPSCSPACPPEARLATAVRTGAFACTSPGDWEGFPRRDRAPACLIAFSHARTPGRDHPGPQRLPRDRARGRGRAARAVPHRLPATPRARPASCSASAAARTPSLAGRLCQLAVERVARERRTRDVHRGAAALRRAGGRGGRPAGPRLHRRRPGGHLQHQGGRRRLRVGVPARDRLRALRLRQGQRQGPRAHGRPVRDRRRREPARDRHRPRGRGGDRVLHEVRRRRRRPHCRSPA